jgi:hypothetical protein
MKPKAEEESLFNRKLICAKGFLTSAAPLKGARRLIRNDYGEIRKIGGLASFSSIRVKSMFYQIVFWINLWV